MIALENIRKDFPILKEKINNTPLIYFDNAATSQRPRCVTDKLLECYQQYNANIHRSAHFLSARATEEYEKARTTLQQFIHAKHSHEILFTKGTTESLNLVAFSFGETYIQKGDEIIVSEMEHHSNIVPWQMLCERKGAKLKVLPFNDKGELELEKLATLLTPQTKLLAISHISNVLGTINPIDTIIKQAHAAGVPVLVDGAQSIVHQQIDVQALDCDFFVCSAHKMYGPTGVGLLYGKEKWLNEIVPYQGGGEMIKEVSFEQTTYNELPYKFEAGTPNFAGAIAFGEAVNYLNKLDFKALTAYEEELLQYAHQKLQGIKGIIFYGKSSQKASLISFNIEGVHHSDIGTLLDKMGIAIRTGHMCADTVMQHYGVEGMIRISFAFYNTKEEIDQFIKALTQVCQMLS